MLYRSFGVQAVVNGVKVDVAFTLPIPVELPSPPQARISTEPAASEWGIASVTFEELHASPFKPHVASVGRPWSSRPRLDSGKIPEHLL